MRTPKSFWLYVVYAIIFTISEIKTEIFTFIESESHSVMLDSLQPHGLYSQWNFPHQNTGGGSLSLFQGIFPSKGLNPCLQHCRWILYQLNYQGSNIKIIIIKSVYSNINFMFSFKTHIIKIVKKIALFTLLVSLNWRQIYFHICFYIQYVITHYFGWMALKKIYLQRNMSLEKGKNFLKAFQIIVDILLLYYSKHGVESNQW